MTYTCWKTLRYQAGVLIVGCLASAAMGCEERANDARDAGPTAVGDAGSGDAGNSDRAGGKGGAGGRQGPTCFADFPCGAEARCVGARQLQRFRTTSCREVCGDRSCSGFGCVATGDIVDCPAGQSCRDQYAGRFGAVCVETDAAFCDDALDGGLPEAGCAVAWGCGDGELRIGESCDDGNRTDHEGCDRNCHEEQGFD